MNNDSEAILRDVRRRFGPATCASWLLEFGYKPEGAQALNVAVAERGRRIIRELTAWCDRRVASLP